MSRRKGLSFLSPQPLMGEMRVRILNPDQSFASSKERVSWVWNSPWARCPLLRSLRLVGQRTALDGKSRSAKAMSRRCSIVLVRMPICDVALSMSAILPAMSVRSGGRILLES